MVQPAPASRPLLTAAQLAADLKARRKSRGWTQADVAGRMGLSQKRYSVLERDPSLLSVAQLIALLAILDFELVIGSRGGARDSVAKRSVEW
jgi:HTH-type transcriptional regulator/antitoxin HipB